MSFKKGIFLLLAFVCCVSVWAQDDLGSSLCVDITKRIVKGLNVTFEEEYRTRSNFSETDRFSHTLELSYKPIQYLKMGGAYNLINFNHEKKGWEIRHRYYFYVTGMLDAGRFCFSIRERFQGTKRVGVEETAKRANPKLYLRSRLKVEYNIPKCKVDPFASVELFNSLNNPQENKMDQWRGIVGVEYKLNKKNTFQLYFRYANHIDDDDSDHHLIGAGYSFKF